jgi:esterase/lipase
MLKVVIITISLLAVASCSSNQSWLTPSGSAAGVPKDINLPFEQYVASSRKNIIKVLEKQRFVSNKSPYIGGYSAAQVASMRGPFQIPRKSSDRCQDSSKGAGKGFLLIHGLTDSPYLLNNMGLSLSATYPCALFRAVLLPGHGTVAGDTLDMKYQDWMGITNYGVNSFAQESTVDELYIIGFSTGTSLAIKHLQVYGKPEKIKGLVLLSTAVKAKSDFAWLASYLKYVKSWLDVKRDRDGARYSSFSTNAGSQFYELTKGMLSEEYQVDVPVLMAVSADDATINPEAAREFFCKYTKHERKLLLWYQGLSKEPLVNCGSIKEVALGDSQQRFKGTNYRYLNVSHTGVSISPDDAHYGVAGQYQDCKYYEQEADDNQWQACIDDKENRLFAEKSVADNEELLQGALWRRGTFNKEYQQLVKSIVCFSDQQCDLNSLTQ